MLKNLVAHELAASIDSAGRRLAHGDAERAQLTLARSRDLLVGLTHAVPGWAGDREFEQDLKMIANYEKALAASAAGQRQRYLADSLQYAAFLKTLEPASR